jgi:hypothetical protein
MASLSTVATTVAGLLVGGYLFLYLHEYTHWAAGKLFSGDPRVFYDSWSGIPHPYAVKYDALERMSDGEVRVAGISPHVVWTTVAAMYLITTPPTVGPGFFSALAGISDWIYSASFSTTVLITASFAAGISVSPSDIVSALRPRKYRTYADYRLSHLGWVNVLLERAE